MIWSKYSAWIMGVLLGYSAISKLFTFGDFQLALLSYPFIPFSALPVIASAVIVTELTCSAMLIMSETRKLGFLFSILLLGVFSAAVFSAYSYGNGVVCGCFGDYGQTNIISFSARNTILLILCWVGFLRTCKNNLRKV